MSDRDQSAMDSAERLLKAVTEQLKSPLLQIAYQAELGDVSGVGQTASRALNLIDGFLLSLEQQKLALEPVSVSSVLYDVAQALDPLARQYNAEIEIDIAGRYGPVMANQHNLEAALVTVGQSLLEADTTRHPRLVLSAYRGKQGIEAGVFGPHDALTAENFRRALDLFGSARQPLAAVCAMNAAGLYVAEALLGTMDSHLEVTRRHKLTGLAASLLPSQQLRLV